MFTCHLCESVTLAFVKTFHCKSKGYTSEKLNGVIFHIYKHNFHICVKFSYNYVAKYYHFTLLTFFNIEGPNIRLRSRMTHKPFITFFQIIFYHWLSAQFNDSNYLKVSIECLNSIENINTYIIDYQ